MAPRLLITGGAGLLAVNWAAAVRDHWDVVLGTHERTVALAGTRSAQVPLEPASALQAALAALAPDLVVHAAGLTSVDRCEQDEAASHHVNTDLAVGVALGCAALGRPLVHISTDHLFSGETPMLTEDALIAPLNAYARAKAAAEAGVLAAHPDALVVRTNFFGWGTSYRHSLSDRILAGLREGRTLTLFEDVHFTPILIEHAALAIHDLVALKARGIVHLTGDERLSKHAFGLRLATAFGLDASLIRRGRIGGLGHLVRRPLDMSLDNTLARRLLGRSLGTIDHHVDRLRQQEAEGLSMELGAL